MSNLATYRIYDQIFTCDRPLSFARMPAETPPEQPRSQEGIWSIREGQGAAVQGDRIHDLEDHPGGNRLQIVEQSPHRASIVYGRWHFELDQDARRILYQPDPDSGWSLDTLLERVVLPIAALLTDRPLIALHGSALRLPDGNAIAIIGDSGAGKSTTALGLLRRGATLLADDLVLIDVERRQILAGAPSLRLALGQEAIPEASASRPTPTPDRKRIFTMPTTESTGRALPLTHLIALGGDPLGDEPFTISRPRGGHAAALVLAQCFAFSSASPRREEARFRRAMHLIRSTPLSLIHFRRGGSALAQLDAITCALHPDAPVQ